MKIRNRTNDNLHVAYLMEANKMNEQVDVLISCFMLNRVHSEMEIWCVYKHLCVVDSLCVYNVYVQKNVNLCVVGILSTLNSQLETETVNFVIPKQYISNI